MNLLGRLWTGLTSSTLSSIRAKSLCKLANLSHNQASTVTLHKRLNEKTLCSIGSFFQPSGTFSQRTVRLLLDDERA